MREISFEIPRATPSLNEIKGMNRYVYKKLMTQFAWLVKIEVGNNFKPFKKCKIEVVRFGSRLLDWDNAYGGLKPLMDCLVVSTKTNPHGLGLIEDDNPKVVTRLTMKQEYAKRNEGKTFVRIWN